MGLVELVRPQRVEHRVESVGQFPVDDDPGGHGRVVAVGGVDVADVPEGVVLGGETVRVRLVDLLAGLEAVPHHGHAVALAPAPNHQVKHTIKAALQSGTEVALSHVYDA